MPRDAERTDPTLALLRAYVALARHLAGEVRQLGPITCCINGDPFTFSVPTRILAEAVGRGGDAEPSFTPNDFQADILAALEGVALRTDALNAAVGTAVHRKPGGILELIEAGLVKHNKTIGYFRPDAPPEPIE